jgi:hypothetical protein
MLKNILAITGKPGLYKLLSRGNNHLIVESLVDGKRMPTYARDRIISVADVSMYTTGEDKPLNEILQTLYAHEEGKQCGLDLSKATNDDLRTWFADILPDYDRDRVYPTDIKKLIKWYNILVNAGITDFSVEENEGDKAEAETNNVEPKQQAHVEKNTAKATSAAKTGSKRTNVAAKKG